MSDTIGIDGAPVDMTPFAVPEKPQLPASASAVPVASLAARLEAIVRAAFERRYGMQSMPYRQARELVWLERDVVEHLVQNLSSVP